MLTRAVNSTSLPLSAGNAGTAPEWVQVMPAGSFAGRSGTGPFLLDDPQGVIDETLAAAAGADLPIDYDHQTLWSRDNGQPAPAAGWVKQFEIRGGSIWARVEWTPAAAARLRDREYRYLSPVFWFDENGRVMRIEHAALTNTPELEMRAVASRLHNNGGEMTPQQYAALCAALGLPADASVESMTAHAKTVADRDTATGQTLAAMAKSLGLAVTADPEAVQVAVVDALAAVNETAQALGLTGPTKPAQLAACAKELLAAKLGQAQTAGTDPAKHVPMSEFLAVSSRLKALENGQAQDKAAEAVAAAMKAGKVTPVNKEWALGYASKDLAGFTSFVDGAPVIVAPGQHGPGGTPPAVAGQMGEADLAVCSRLGLDPETYKKHLQTEGK